MRKPYYLKSRDTWMVWINGRQERLGKGLTEEQAWDKYRELQEFRGPLRPTSTVELIFEAFLDDVEANAAKGTYDWYNNFLSAFARKHRNLPLNELAPHHVTTWANRGFTNPSTRHGAIRSVQRALNWAVDQKLISHSPIVRIKKPTPNRRETVVGANQWAGILEKEKKSDWRDFLVFMRETGCRVQEMRILSAVHFDSQFSRFIIPANKAKGKRKPRVIYCNGAALDIVKRRMEKHPEGPIFRNTRGRPLTRNAIRCRFRRYGTGLCATLLRHTYITEALIKGTDCVTVAALCGHDPATTAKIYQHLSQDPKYMQDVARKIRS